jgi:hypothetical protein
MQRSKNRSIPINGTPREIELNSSMVMSLGSCFSQERNQCAGLLLGKVLVNAFCGVVGIYHSPDPKNRRCAEADDDKH